ncbi:hypothetical protein D3C81_1401370 [compost metagenome]
MDVSSNLSFPTACVPAATVFACDNNEGDCPRKLALSVLICSSAPSSGNKPCNALCTETCQTLVGPLRCQAVTLVLPGFLPTSMMLPGRLLEPLIITTSATSGSATAIRSRSAGVFSCSCSRTLTVRFISSDHAGNEVNPTTSTKTLNIFICQPSAQIIDNWFRV